MHTAPIPYRPPAPAVHLRGLLALWVRRGLGLLLACCGIFGPPLAHAQSPAGRVAVPRQQGAVTDLTGTLTADQVQALRQKIARLHDDAPGTAPGGKGPTLAVLLVPTTAPETIEQFAIRVFDEWKPGTAKDDNGLLLLVALKDRRMRIEVGQGLEGQVPDLAANRIIEEQMRPRFRQQDFFGGIDAAVDALAALTGGAPAAADADPGVVTEEAPPATQGGWTITTAGMLVLSIVAAAVLYGAFRWRRFGLLVAGAVVVCVALWATAHYVDGEAALFAGLGLVGLVVAGMAGRFMLRNMREVYRRGPGGFAARSVVVLLVAAIAGVVEESWGAAAFGGFLALFFTFIPSVPSRGGGGFTTGGWSSGSDSSSSSSSSDSSSSSSSDSGGSSSGGGSSGDW